MGLYEHLTILPTCVVDTGSIGDRTVNCMCDRTFTCTADAESHGCRIVKLERTTKTKA